MKKIKEFIADSAWFWIPLLAASSVVSFLEGMADTVEENGCPYKSYLAQYNPPYRLGCWLLEDRSKEKKDKQATAGNWEKVSDNSFRIQGGYVEKYNQHASLCTIRPSTTTFNFKANKLPQKGKDVVFSMQPNYKVASHFDEEQLKKQTVKLSLDSSGVLWFLSDGVERVFGHIKEGEWSKITFTNLDAPWMIKRYGTVINSVNEVDFYYDLSPQQ